MRQKSDLHRVSKLAGRRLWLAIGWFTIACASAGQAGLEGSWRLTSIASSPLESPAADELPFFTIKGMSVEGFDGCNQFFGPLDRPGAIGATRRACPAGTLVLPLDLSDLAAHLRTGRIEGDVLAVPARGPYPASTYVRQSAP